MNQAHTRRLRLPTLAGLAISASAASAQPGIYLSTSGGYLLHTKIGEPGIEIVGQDPDSGRSQSIITLETDRRGQLWAAYTIGQKPDSTELEFGVVARVNRQTGIATRAFALSSDPNFVTEGNGLALGGGMAIDANGNMWMANYFLGGTTPISLHQIDTDTGQIISNIQTDVPNDTYGAAVFRDDGMLTMISYSNQRLTIVDPPTGIMQSQTTLNGPGLVTGLTQYEGITYLSTQYGDVYSFDLDTYDYELVASYGDQTYRAGLGTVWGITVNPTPGTALPVLAGLALAARRRRQAG